MARSHLLTGLLATVLVATGPAALLAACSADSALYGEAVATTKAGVKRGSVTHVVDGDTIDVRMPSGAEKRVRLLGIDTPEVYGEVECGGPEASAWTKRYLPVGTRVELVSDPSQSSKDQYGRLLRYVTKLSTGKDVNRRLVATGWATLFVWDGDPFARVTSYRTALRSAKDAGRGIWGLC